MTNTKILSVPNSNMAIIPFKIKQALVALELGDGDEKLLDYLDFFSRQIPIEAAEFLHVLPKFDLLNAIFGREGSGFVSNYELNEETIREMKIETKTRLERRNILPAGNQINKVEYDVREGNPLEELLKEVTETKADLTIIGQKSARGQHGILARNLARKASNHALIVPEGARARLRKIMIPIDFSASSIKGLQTALAINKQLKEPAEIICVNVYEMPNIAAVYIRKTTEELKKMIEQDRMEAFQTFLKTYGGPDQHLLKTILIENRLGDIGTYLMDYALESNADLIIMGAKGHSKVELLLLGSVTERLLSENDVIPTLIVK
ncbi:MAG: universal stress protein [Saprospiraceae bacterium]|nr:universal stress protein [Saprospiraceae bacterium]